MSTLIQIAPPLSQSRYEQLACPEFYAETQVRGVKMPASEASERGTDVHAVMANYVRHCVKNKVRADWAAFDEFAAASGLDAGGILDGLRDSYEVDYEHVVRVEERLCLSDSFQAQEERAFLDESIVGYFPLPSLLLGGVMAVPKQHRALSGMIFTHPSCCEGTPDIVLFFGDGSGRAKVDDFKTHPRPFDADTFQSMLYSFMVMQGSPDVQSVEFELIFVRYKNARRSVVWTRAQMPEMMRQIERARQRQLAVHEAAASGATMEARPGAHCQYCPHLAKGTCPVREQNPHATMTMEDRVRFGEWLRQQAKLNTDILKAHVDVHGPVTATDANGKPIEAGYQPTESAWYPLFPALALLEEWAEVVPEDSPRHWKDLRIGSTQLRSKLKPKKRADLDQRMKDEVCVHTSDVKFKLTRVGDEDEEQ